MRVIQLAATAVAAAGLASLASAQFTTIGPFTGNAGTEGFETQTQSAPFLDCIEDRVFGAQADLCAPGGCLLASGWNFSCGISPYAGGVFFGSASVAAEYTFDDACTKFGGYFGTNYDQSGPGTIEFYDEFGNLLHSDTIAYTFDCTWHWNGWDTGGAAVKSIKVIGAPFGGFVMMDDMEADLGGGGGTGTGYCFGDPGVDTPCPCGNDNDGSVPGSGCANGVFASGANLTGAGVASLGSDTLVLATTGLEPTNSGLYFQADNDLSPGNVWGDGLQCAGGSLKRLGVRFADATGASDTSGFPTSISVKAGNIVAGDTKYYQCWYRNPNGTPCGSDFNASNGLAVVWGP